MEDAILGLLVSEHVKEKSLLDRLQWVAYLVGYNYNYAYFSIL